MPTWIPHPAVPLFLGISAAMAADTHRVSASFACDGGRKILAIFTNGSHSSVELTLSDGRHLILPQALSASGARYTNQQESFVFWNKGRTAFIEEAGQRTYDGCVQATPR